MTTGADMRGTHRRWTTSLGAGALVLALATGCADSETATTPADAADAAAAPPRPGASHTMADGTTMPGSEHGDHEDHGDHGAADAAGPSRVASMICGGSVATDVRRLLGLDMLPAPVSTWSPPVFRCTFDLEEGPLVLSVHDVEDLDEGMAHFEGRAEALAPVTELVGMYGLGLPAFETVDGTAAFIREGKTLEVDATALGARMGPDRSLDRSDLAYAVATSVLACWTEHD